MAQPQTFWLREERDRRFALAAVYRAPLGLEVRLGTRKRTTEQERRLRSMIKAIMDSGTTWAGEEWDSDCWREILVSAYLTHKGKETGKLIQGMEGEPVAVGRRRGSDLDTQEFGELMDMTIAFIDQRGITWTERAQEDGYEAYR